MVRGEMCGPCRPTAGCPGRRVSPFAVREPGNSPRSSAGRPDGRPRRRKERVMEYEQMIATVRKRADLGENEAVRSIQAVLSVLGERLAGQEADHLAAQLPEGLDASVTRNPQGRRWDVGEFLKHVGDREQVANADQVRQHAQAVLRTVAEALDDDQRHDLLAQLPGGITDLFGVPTPRG
ncbi:DUF2267 domain-containing protein [Micromonospora sp. CV4]|nr:DUF2267 domain-containing protein [Micromonospora sp. CV4]